ncbi:MAG: YihY family inner membrane protein [Myxococcota bacterium]|jgi:YihY family inner membrane protein
MQRDIRELYGQVKDRQDARWSKPLLTVVHFTVALWLKSQRDRLPLRTAMLTYWSSVAVVPMLLLAFALTGAAGLAAKPARDLLYDILLAGSVDEIRFTLDELLNSTSLRALGAAGVIGVLFIGAQLFFQAERAYNDILYSSPTGNLLNRFFAFYAALTLGPLIITAGFVLSNQLTADTHLVDTSWLTGVFNYLAPSLVTAVVFVGAIRFLPSKTLSWQAVLWGGLSSALLFEGAKRGFSAYTDLLGTKDSMVRIYGSLGLLPVFLIWVNLLWTIVLLGVEIAYIRENWVQLVDQHERWVSDKHLESRQPDMFFMLSVLSVIGQRYLCGEGATSADDISAALGADGRHVLTTIEAMCAASLVLQTTNNRYLPALPLDKTTARDAVTAWRSVSSPQTDPDHPSRLLENQWQEALHEQLSQPLSEVVMIGWRPEPAEE